jgi:hypothetical protein
MFAYVLTIYTTQGILTVYRLQYGLHMLLRGSLEVSAMQACLMCQDAHMVDICMVAVVRHAHARDVAASKLCLLALHMCNAVMYPAAL